jgi:hypothetical protein
MNRSRINLFMLICTMKGITSFSPRLSRAYLAVTYRLAFCTPVLACYAYLVRRHLCRPLELLKKASKTYPLGFLRRQWWRLHVHPFKVCSRTCGCPHHNHCHSYPSLLPRSPAARDVNGSDFAFIISSTMCLCRIQSRADNDRMQIQNRIYLIADSKRKWSGFRTETKLIGSSRL